MSKEAMKLALETLEVWKGYMPARWDKTDEQAITALREALAEQPAQQEPLTELAKAVIDAARTAMDESVEAYDSQGSIKIDSHLAASLSLCLDEYDRAIEAAHGIKGGA